MEDCVDLLSLYFKICKNVNAWFFIPKGLMMKERELNYSAL